MTAAADLPTCEDVAWFRDDLNPARGAAAALGRRIGLDGQRTDEVALAVAELAAHAHRHTDPSALLLRAVHTQQATGIEVVVLASRPDGTDAAPVGRDGRPTEDPAEAGLDEVRELADTFDTYALPGRGTVRLARFWSRATAAQPVGGPVGEPVVGGITRPISGEQVCGDAWATRADAGEPGTAPSATVPSATAYGTASGRPLARAATDSASLASARSFSRSAPLRASQPGSGGAVLVMLCDGLGHGPMASLAGQAAARAFENGRARVPEQIMEEIHRALRGTRGAAVAVARIEPDDGRLLFCGVGNIAATLITADSRATLLSHPGIVGHQMHQPRTYEHTLPQHSTLVLHSDGLSDRWTTRELPGLLQHSPTLIAAQLLRHAGTRRDDASVVVARGLW
jgi:anti-sigma regulatory factor (Ser/Thr protein kinase)